MTPKRTPAHGANIHPDHPELPGINQGRKAAKPRLRPELERGAGAGALGAVEAKDGHPERFLVRVTSIRKRLLDEDNLCPKYVIDCCRYAHLIPDDSPEKVNIEVRQRKAAKGEAEETLVEIYKL